MFRGGLIQDFPTSLDSFHAYFCSLRAVQTDPKYGAKRQNVQNSRVHRI